MKNVIISGQGLTPAIIQSIVTDPRIKIKIAPAALSKVKKSQEFLKQEYSSRVIYGVNTGFGPMASHILSASQVVTLQENLIKSHAVGIGKIVEEKFVLAAMMVRLNTLVKGYSGVSPELLNHLANFINHRIIPVVPEHGAVGTSGDLIQLAHIALALVGEGQVFYKGKKQPVKKVLKQLGIKPYQVKVKEGLALINGTSFMSGIGSLICVDSDYLLNLAIKTGALALELVHGFNDSFSEKLSSLRPHQGQVFIAGQLRRLLADSKLLQDRHEFQKKVKLGDDVKEIPESVQEVYSIRCIPQILGPIYDTLAKTKGVIGIEINSVTDNPIIDVADKSFLHGGNFHGDYIASSLDMLKMTLVKLTMLTERRINFFLNRNVNRFLTPFINLRKPGLNLALQGLQFVATSTTAHSQTLAFPQYVHSIPTNGDNQDVVSMGTGAALLTNKVAENAREVLAIELITLTQAVDFLKIQKKLSRSSAGLYKAVRQIFPAVVEDRILVEELPRFLEALRNKSIS